MYEKKRKYKILHLIIPEWDKGSYGTACNETCGHCRRVSQCSNVNGKCLTGCEAGFEGDLCKTGKENISGTGRGTKSFSFIFQTPSYYYFLNKHRITCNSCIDIQTSALILRQHYISSSKY